MLTQYGPQIIDKAANEGTKDNAQESEAQTPKAKQRRKREEDKGVCSLFWLHRSGAERH